MKKISAIVLAAGLGTRLRSKTAKVLHPVAGRPMVWYAVSLAGQVADAPVVVVIGHQAEWFRAFLEQSRSAFGPCKTVLQPRQLGTAHAVQQAKSVLMRKGEGGIQALPDCQWRYPSVDARDNQAVGGPP